MSTEPDAPGPLAGLSIVVTRAKAQASVLNEQLVALGATPIPVATIAIVPPEDGGATLRAALRATPPPDQIVVASPNGARVLAATVAEMIAAGEVDGSALAPVACVGPSTAARLSDSALRVNVVPDEAVAEGLVDALAAPASGRDRLLLVQAEVARDVLETGLGAKGWQVERVTAYRTVDAQVDDESRRRAAAADLVTFTSSSTVERYLRLVGRDALPPVVASIGPVTSATARDLDLHVDIEADPHTIAGLVDALVDWAVRRGP